MITRAHLALPAVLFYPLALAVAGCATRGAIWDTETAMPRRAAMGTTVGSDDRRSRMLAEGETYWAQRADETQLRNAIARFEDALAIDPGHPEEWARVSRGYYFLADSFMSSDPTQRPLMLATYERGIVAAERGLLVSSPVFSERVRNGMRLSDALQFLDTSAAGCLYWRAQNLSRFMPSQGLAAQIASRDDVFAMLQRETELDDDYFYGGAHRVLGKLYAGLSGYQGGDPARSREQFERALEEGPDFFPTRVEYAESWAVAARDRAAFERQLGYVLNADATANPAVAPENLAAQRKARELLDKEATLFR